jgi:hypothetical protein
MGRGKVIDDVEEGGGGWHCTVNVMAVEGVLQRRFYSMDPHPYGILARGVLVHVV